MAMTPTECPVHRWNTRRLRSFSTINTIRKLAQYLRSAEIDILQMYYRDSMLVGVPAAYLAGVPRVVMTAFNDGYWMSPLDRWLYRCYQPFIHDMVVNCEAVKTSLVNNVSWPIRKITVIENGIDLEAYRNITPWVPLTTFSAQRRVGMIANLRSVKDPQTFIKAAAIVNARYPDTRFVIAGEGELRHGLETMIADLGLAGVVDLPGTSADTPAFLSTLDIAVLCSQSEGMSNAVIEYMAAGRPSIATAVGGNSELITHDTTGLLVPPNSPAELAAAIERYIEDPECAARSAHCGQEEATSRFSMQTMAKRYEDFYQSLF